MKSRAEREVDRRIKRLAREIAKDAIEELSFWDKIKVVFSKRSKANDDISVSSDIDGIDCKEDSSELIPISNMADTLELDKLMPVDIVESVMKDNDGPFSMFGRHHVEEKYSYVRIKLKVDEVSPDNPMPFVLDGIDSELVYSSGTDFIGVVEDKEYNIIVKHPVTFQPKENQPKVMRCKCICVVDDYDYQLFSNYPDLENKAEKISAFARLSHEQREYIHQQFTRPKVETENKRNPIMDVRGLQLVYEVCGKSFPQNIQEKAAELFGKLEHGLVGGSDRADIVNRLSHMLNVKMYSQKKINKSYEEIISILDKHIYGMKELKEFIAERLMMMQYTSSASMSLLIVGNPGVGKTSVVRAIAECLDREIIEVDCEGSDAINIKGLFSSWGGAKSGKIAEGLWMKGDNEVVIDLEELDKISICDRGNPYDALIKPLGPTKQFYDEYVGTDYDVSSTVWIATANDITKIPDYLQNRFDKIIYISDYSVEEKVAIAKHYTIPTILDDNGIEKDCITFTDKALRTIASEYCFDAGVRDMKGNVEDLICKVVSGWSRKILGNPFEIDENFVKDNLVCSQGIKKGRRIGFTA